MLFTSCNYTPQDSDQIRQNPHQELFKKFLIKSRDEYIGIGNVIQKREFEIEFCNQFEDVVDSIGVFSNWTGILKNLLTADLASGSMTEISFDIEVELSDNQKLTLNSKEIYFSDSLMTNLIYRQLKNLQDNSVVYFDGFIEKDREHKSKFSNYGFADLISQPALNFSIVSISKNPILTESTTFKKRFELESKFWKLIQSKEKGKIDEKVFKEKNDEYQSQIKLINCSADELEYFKSLRYKILDQLLSWHR